MSGWMYEFFLSQGTFEVRRIARSLAMDTAIYLLVVVLYA